MSYSYSSSSFHADPVYSPGGDLVFPHTSSSVPRSVPIEFAHIYQPQPTLQAFDPGYDYPLQVRDTTPMHSPTRPGRHGSQPYPRYSTRQKTVDVPGPARSRHDAQPAQPSKRKHSTRDLDATARRKDKRERDGLPGTRVPQTGFPPCESAALTYRYAPVCFTQMSDDFQVRPFARAYSIHIPEYWVLSGDDRVMRGMPERRIKVRILWPGYKQYPFVKYLDTGRGGATRGEMFRRTAVALLEFFNQMVKDRSYKNVEPGYESWAIHKRPDGQQGIRFEDVVITSLVHRAGSEWKVDLRVL